MKTLIIAEKPSVATDLARVLGKVPKKGDYFENDKYVISSAIGHLVELYMPEEISPDYKRWSLKNLPIIPEKFEIKPITRTKKKFSELKKLIARKDVDLLINACDAGREGELIFNYIRQASKTKKEVKRLWMSSMTPDAIRTAFNSLRDSDEMKPLEDAARSRSEADWLIGINGTRGATVQFGRYGGRAATVGRVQTPTLTLVYQRELDIEKFVPRDYWRIIGNFGITKGEYQGIYQKPDFKKNDDEHDRADRLWEKQDAERILAEVNGCETATVTEEKKRTRQNAPRLYDLTSLQREANSRFGFPAAMTLSIAQSLYEKHKALTYPRTDSRALPEDYGPVVASSLKSLPPEYQPFAKNILQQNWIKPGNKRIFNNKQISDHFAIIPTESAPKKLSETEQKIYDMVTRRLLAVFYPAAEFDVTTRLSLANQHTFKTEGKVLVFPGWLEVYGKATHTKDTLPALSTEDGSPAQAKIVDVELEEDQTAPPPRFNEATLLAAMEGAGKFVDDEELAEAMKEKGLGTPATRAQIIDHLVKENYMERFGKELAPTEKARALIQFLQKFKIDILTSPAMTGEWEFNLRRVEEKKLSRSEFMKGIVSLTKEMVDKLNSPPPKTKTTVLSPTNGQPLVEDHRSWQSIDTIEVKGRTIPSLSINKVIGNRKTSISELVNLLKDRQIGPLDGFRSRAGKNFSAYVKLVEKPNGSLRAELDFGNSEGGENGEGGEAIDLSQYPVIGESPVDATPVHETPNAYISAGNDKNGRPAFRLSRNLLGKALPADIVKKLLSEHKSDLIKGFRSKRTGRLFDAFLLLDDKGKISFEFPPKPKKTKKKKTPAK